MDEKGTKKIVDKMLCPICAEMSIVAHLVERKNSLTGETFLGCENYPKCRYTREMPEEYKLRRMGAKGLFDNLMEEK